MAKGARSTTVEGKLGPDLKAERVQKPQRLTAGRVKTRLGGVPGWTGKDRSKTLVRSYRFASFRVAVAFVQFAGEVAEHFGHYPDIDVRGTQVTVTLTSREAGGLTERDFELARALNRG